MHRETICRIALQMMGERHLLNTVPILFLAIIVFPCQRAKAICLALKPSSEIQSCFPVLAAKCALSSVQGMDKGSVLKEAVLLLVLFLTHQLKWKRGRIMTSFALSQCPGIERRQLIED